MPSKTFNRKGEERYKGLKKWPNTNIEINTNYLVLIIIKLTKIILFFSMYRPV